MSIPCPEDLGKFSTFHRTFLDFEQKDEVVSYACLLYTVSKVIKSENITPSLKSYISQALGRLESWKKEFTNTSYNEIISNETILGNHISNVANKIFSWAETNDLAQNYTIDVIQSYYLSSILFIVAAHFSDEGDDNDDDLKRKFAMQRSLYIKRCLKADKPISTYDSYCAAFDESLGLSTSGGGPSNLNANLNSNSNSISNSNTNPNIATETNTSAVVNQQLDSSQHQDISYSTFSSLNQPASTSQNFPIKHKINSHNEDLKDIFASNTVYSSSSQNLKKANSSHNQDILNDSDIDYNTSQQAQKFVKHAGSALSYDDVDTALDLLYKTIALIEPFSKKSKHPR